MSSDVSQTSADDSQDHRLSSEEEQLIVDVTNRVTSLRSETPRGTTPMLEKAEQAERVRALEFFELKLDAEHPYESPALKQQEALYNMHLLSDEAIARLIAGDDSLYEEEMLAGRMMNRFRPTKREEETYRHLFQEAGAEMNTSFEYETVCDQHVADMLGSSNRPGRYKVFGLRDPANPEALVASLSLRLPDSTSAYIETTARSLERVQFNQGWHDATTMSQIPTTAEIDTIIADPRFPGAGLRIVFETLTALQDAGELPEHFIYYRSNGIVMHGQSGLVYPPGVNSSSFIFFVRKLGFTDMGDRSDSRDVMVREVTPGQEPFVANTRWTFGSKATKPLLKRIVPLVQKQQVVENPSRLILPS